MSLYMFIAADYPMPLMNNKGTKYFKFKKGVKIDVDVEGKIYYYTNKSDRNSPDLLIPCSPEEADSIVVDSEESFQEIQILKGIKSDFTEWYTDKNNIYIHWIGDIQTKEQVNS